ncbi:MAG: nuclear transport factor 2 family protein [Bacteroidota bacterium]
MRVLLFFSLFLFLAYQDATGQDKSSAMETDETAVKTALTEFLSAGDVRDVARLEAVLNPQFRVCVNQFMGQPGVTVIDRAGYLGMIGAGKLGGSPRQVAVRSVEVVGNVAFVRATLDSDTLHFESNFVLAQDALGDWTVLSDTPYTTAK